MFQAYQATCDFVPRVIARPYLPFNCSRQRMNIHRYMGLEKTKSNRETLPNLLREVSLYVKGPKHPVYKEKSKLVLVVLSKHFLAVLMFLKPLTSTLFLRGFWSKKNHSFGGLFLLIKDSWAISSAKTWLRHRPRKRRELWRLAWPGVF